VIIQTYDVIRALRDAGVAVAGGFHSPMETECLEFLLRGQQQVVLCAAIGLANFPMTAELAQSVKAGRLCILSSFGAEVIHATSAEGMRRNEVVSAMADALLVPHAIRGGRAEACVTNTLKRGQRVLTFADPANEHLVRIGAIPATPSQLAALYG